MTKKMKNQRARSGSGQWSKKNVPNFPGSRPNMNTLTAQVRLMSEDWWVIRDRNGRLVISMLTGGPMVLHRSLADETRADLDFEDRKRAPHRIERLPATVDDHA